MNKPKTDKEINLFKGIIKGDRPFWQELVLVIIMLAFAIFALTLIVKTLGVIGFISTVGAKWLQGIIDRRPP